jgi:HEPN domain-containing protein
MTEDEITRKSLPFMQQAVEKALKALLVQYQVEFPRTHVIGVLLTLCKKAVMLLVKI